MSVAATIEARVGIEVDELVWQQSKEGVQGKPAIHGERESATWKVDMAMCRSSVSGGK